ncbi:signal peptidase I [Bacillus piscicola]|uniref:signal peptidase I n=1 Tax=Bacillus piscicola TaxID=1632684 RepID=UPI001F090F05|nr:signal peptidase I [Bacillus piscicola]
MVKRFGHFILNSFLVLLFVLFLIGVFFIYQEKANPDQVPSIFGYHPLTVLSNSMQPAFSAGDMVLTKEVDPETIEQGDIITYRDKRDQIITHRVIEKVTEEETVFQTQGDNNNVADDYQVMPDQVMGVVDFTIPKGGYVAQFLGSPLGMVIFIVIPLFTLVGITVYEKLGKTETDVKDKKHSTM